MPLFFTLDDIYKLYNTDPTIRVDGIVVLDKNDRPKIEYPDHRHQFDGLLFSFMIKGTMKSRIHFLEYEVNVDDTVVILPQLMIDVHEFSDDAEMITMGLSLDFIASFSTLREFIMNDQIRWRPVIKLNEERQQQQKELLALILKIYREKQSPKKKEILQHLIIALIHIIAEVYTVGTTQNTETKSRTHELIDNFYVLITKHAIEERRVKFYADQLYLTPQYLSTLLKQTTGKSVLQWIDHIVIMQAKTLIKTSNLTIKEISNQLHFVDSSLFCRYFKRHTGFSPKAFKHI
ncbi:helix-turn-helix transcriptional regulator [Sphingobacterium paucimobilis]|uniref:HTH araC/xylS-type domain-containing protein n=1 Tax=Sphingobacterium paucimobilis HER1398 TaxID=1346330 RepID=U2J1B0_9SPHI|nr:helix-turn-helix transcriptional regulator [Sphingobacterium paucimobilis]ERJ58749.1 hypothetical protein M472_08205 [Sphingobacterium paucimobilis HER1398]